MPQLPSLPSTLHSERDISAPSDAAHSFKSTRLRHFNLDYRFCLGQLRFHDAVVESHTGDSVRLGESGYQLSYFVGLDTRHLSLRTNLFVANPESDHSRLYGRNRVCRDELGFGSAHAGTAAEGRRWIFRLADGLAWLLYSVNNSVAHGTFATEGSALISFR